MVRALGHADACAVDTGLQRGMHAREREFVNWLKIPKLQGTYSKMIAEEFIGMDPT